MCTLKIWIYQIFSYLVRAVIQYNPMSKLPYNLLLEPQSQLLHGEYSLVRPYSTDHILCHIAPHSWSKCCHLTLQLHKLGLLRRPRQFLACKVDKTHFSIWFCFQKTGSKKTIVLMQVIHDVKLQRVFRLIKASKGMVTVLPNVQVYVNSALQNFMMHSLYRLL